MKVAVIGAGYWGPNLIRNFLMLDEVETVVACDLDEGRLAKMRKMFHGIETSTRHNAVIERSDIDKNPPSLCGSKTSVYANTLR